MATDLNGLGDLLPQGIPLKILDPQLHGADAGGPQTRQPFRPVDDGIQSQWSVGAGREGCRVRIDVCGAGQQGQVMLPIGEMADGHRTTAAGNAIALPEPLIDGHLADHHGIRQGVTEGQGRGDGRGQGATGTAIVGAFLPWAGKPERLLPGTEKILAEGAVAVTALQQHGLCAGSQQSAGSGFHIVAAVNRQSTELFRLLPVGGEQGTEWQQFGLEGDRQVGFRQGVAAAAGQHRVDHQRRAAAFYIAAALHRAGVLNKVADGCQLLPAGDQTHLDGGDRQGFHGAQLFGQHFAVHRLDGQYLAVVLGRIGGDRRRTVYAHGGQGADIHLHPGHAGAIAAGDGEDYRLGRMCR